MTTRVFYYVLPIFEFFEITDFCGGGGWGGWMTNLLLEVGAESVHAGVVFDADNDGNTRFLLCFTGFQIFRYYGFFGGKTELLLTPSVDQVCLWWKWVGWLGDEPPAGGWVRKCACGGSF